MSLYNYKAFSVNTELNSKILIADKDLENFINDLQANKTFYHCYYDLEKRDSFVDYEGILRPVFDTVHFDFDSEDDLGAAAWEDTKRFCKRLQESGVSFHCYFSGNKGFHVAVHKSAINITQGEKVVIQDQIKNLCFGLKKQYPTLDTRIWNANRKFRAYRSKHEKSGLYKIRLTGLNGDPASSFTIEQIRNMALTQPAHKYAHPMQSEPCDWLIQFTTNATPLQQQGSRKQTVREIAAGSTVDDDSLRFKNFRDKKCVKDMLTGNVLPQFNRHDIELALIYDLRNQGFTVNEASKTMRAWAEKVYPGEPDRVTDCDRQVQDAYKRSLEDNKLYKFGCYGDIKAAYCSAKCKIYNSLDRKRRAEPLDCTRGQQAENEARRNENLELSEGQIADRILGALPELCKASGQYFQWEKTHWKRIDGPMFEDAVRKSAMAAYENQAGIRQVKNLAEHILSKIPMAPETNNFFTSSPNKFNFTDCTAEIISDEKGSLRLETREHSKNDYLSYCAPFPLKGEHGLKMDGEFKKYLETRKQDVGDEGIRIIKQMLGAALIPYSPRIFFIEGITNAGKSTLALLIKKLLGADNVAEVQPVVQGNGGDRFNWEPSIGKLANIVLELDDRKPLDTTVLKMIRDKTAVSLDRKGKGHVKATLPFFHVYCCNQMPPSLEGNSGALNNRVTMLYFKPGYLNGSSGVVEYAEWIWAQDAGGVLEAAREGLKDLMESGFKYYESEESKLSVKFWQKRNDSISLWLEDLAKNEWSVEGLEGKEWERASLFYKSFKEWCSDSGKKFMGKNTFYEQLRKKHGVESKDDALGGVRFRATGVLKAKTEQKPSEKSPMITDTIAF